VTKKLFGVKDEDPKGDKPDEKPKEEKPETEEEKQARRKAFRHILQSMSWILWKR